jgi:hypothetical protein
MTTAENPHNDLKLASKFYPCGDKNVANSTCFCGSIQIKTKTDNPVMSAFCHCGYCRVGHAAPLYQVLYCTTANIGCKTGNKKEGEHEIQIVKGFEHLTSFPGGMANPFHKKTTDNERVGGIGRMHCNVCGTRMLNAFYHKLDGKERYGVFPGTFMEPLSNFIREWQPRSHLNCESAIMPVAAICDGLPKFVEWDTGAKFIE